MSEKNASIISYIAFVILAVVYLNTASGFNNSSSNTIGPEYLPRILGYGLLTFSIIGIITSLFQKNKDKISLQNLPMILVATITTILFLVIWYFVGYFYFLALIYLMGLTALFRKELGFGKKNILIIVSTSLGIVITFYLIFTLLMGIDL